MPSAVASFRRGSACKFKRDTRLCHALTRASRFLISSRSCTEGRGGVLGTIRSVPDKHFYQSPSQQLRVSPVCSKLGPKAPPKKPRNIFCERCRPERPTGCHIAATAAVYTKQRQVPQFCAKFLRRAWCGALQGKCMFIMTSTLKGATPSGCNDRCSP